MRTRCRLGGSRDLFTSVPPRRTSHAPSCWPRRQDDRHGDVPWLLKPVERTSARRASGFPERAGSVADEVLDGASPDADRASDPDGLNRSLCDEVTESPRGDPEGIGGGLYGNQRIVSFHGENDGRIDVSYGM